MRTLLTAIALFASATVIAPVLPIPRLSSHTITMP